MSGLDAGRTGTRDYRGLVREPGTGKRPRLGGNGFRSILVATAIAGTAGYLIQAVAGWGLEPSEYAEFGVFWATFYLLVGAIAGIQQEIARATHPADTSNGAIRKLVAFAAVAAACVAGVICVSSPLWGPAVFGEAWVAPAFALLAGTVAYVGFAVLSGLLYGHRAWRPLATVIVADPVLRLVFVSAALAIGGSTLLDWAIVAPIPITLAIGLALVLRSRMTSTRISERIRELLANSARTLLGAAATAVLISALPLFIAVSAHGEESSEVGALIFNLTITRAPLVIPILAFQSWLIVRFRDASPGWLRGFGWLLAAIGAVAGVLSVIAWFVVGPIVGAVFGSGYVIGPWLVAGIVLTAGLTAALCASGAVVIARGGHTAYLVGWAVAAGTAIGGLFLPLPLDMRLLVALAVGPALGLAIHTWDLAVRSRDDSRSEPGRAEVPPGPRPSGSEGVSEE